MPARSVVIEKLSKFTGERHEFLTPGEYTQLTGRAGRRGIDERGLRGRAAGARSCRSTRSRRWRRAAPTRCARRFGPTYNMAANLVRRYSQFEAHHLLNLSFAQFHADRDVVALERQLERSRADARPPARGARTSDAGDVDEYRRLQARARDGAPQTAAARAGSPTRSRRCGPATSSWSGGRGGRLVVLEPRPPPQAARRASSASPRPRRRAARSRRLRRARRGGSATIELPRPVRAAQPGVPAQVADRLRAARSCATTPGARAATTGGSRSSRTRSPSTPLAGDPAPATHGCAAPAAVDRLERDVQRLERRVRGRSDSLARQFDRVLRVLESWGYVDGWSLTPAGERLARLYTETDLLVAEAIGEGLLDGLRVARARGAGVVLHLRAPRARRQVADAAAALADRRRSRSAARAIDRLARDLNANEDDAGLPETRAPDPGLHRATCTSGRRATPSPTCSTTTR